MDLSHRDEAQGTDEAIPQDEFAGRATEQEEEEEEKANDNGDDANGESDPTIHPLAGNSGQTAEEQRSGFLLQRLGRKAREPPRHLFWDDPTKVVWLQQIRARFIQKLWVKLASQRRAIVAARMGCE